MIDPETVVLSSIALWHVLFDICLFGSGVLSYILGIRFGAWWKRREDLRQRGEELTEYLRQREARIYDYE